MNELPKELTALHERWPPVDDRVAEILANIRRDCGDFRPGEKYNQANERQVEEFIARLKSEFGGRAYEVERGAEDERAEWDANWTAARERDDAPVVVIERQRLSEWALRTTRWNYVFTVPGRTRETYLMVAHYDTWRGPGADDNTTGEEILKQYLLADLHRAERSHLTHVYFLAGSEECGLVGLLSQLLLAAGIIAALEAWRLGNWWLVALALALCPLASYRFGVSGSREYVRALAPDELRRLVAVVAVDSVGEGRLYIPRSTLGADFLRALIPFGDYDAFTDVLEQAAHLHGIKYNSYIAGGTTDHVSFLEVNNGFWARARQLAARTAAWLGGRDYRPGRRIPASALIAMLPGKASPIVFGGKIHTRNDVPERVYPEPLRDSLLILDYVFHIVEGGARLRQPRHVGECHYARLYEVRSLRDGRVEHWLALKDALEPNRRNLNAFFRVEGEIDEAAKEARVTVREPVGWGVHTRLRHGVADLCQERNKSFRRVRLDRLWVREGGEEYEFARHLTALDQVRRRALRALGWVERLMGAYSFITFFLMAIVISEVVGWAVGWGFARWFWFQEWFFRWEYATIPLVLIFQIGVLVYLMAWRVPTWIDNNYRHANRADNMGSLRRVRAGTV